MKNHSIKLILSSIVAVTPFCYITTGCNNNNTSYFKGIATTTCDLVGHDEYVTDEQAVKGLYDAGFRYIDLSLYSLTPNHPYMVDGWKEKIVSLKNCAKNLGMTFVQAHSQGGDPFSTKQEDVDFLIKATIRSIEICDILGIKNTVVHPGNKEGLTKEQWFTLNKEFYNKLLPTAEKYNVNILCENTTQLNAGSAWCIKTGASMREFVKYVNHKNFHACWDTGHANCEANQSDNIRALGDELYSIHYNDNLGNGDQHLMLYCGTLDNKVIVDTLKEIKFNGWFTLECDSNIRNQYPYKGPVPVSTNDVSIKHLNRLEQEKLLYKSAVEIVKL